MVLQHGLRSLKVVAKDESLQDNYCFSPGNWDRFPFPHKLGHGQRNHFTCVCKATGALSYAFSQCPGACFHSFLNLPDVRPYKIHRYKTLQAEKNIFEALFLRCL
jgi:hypothetical protein